MKNSPCYNNGKPCPRRAQICHAQCKEYHEWVADRRKEREAAREAKDADAHTQHTIEIKCKRANTRKRVGQR